MTIEQFARAVKVANLLETDWKWFPKWIRGYALFHKIAPSDSLTLDENRVIGYLRHLRDKGTHAWQRKQAAKALQTYQNILVRQELVHFQPILKKLRISNSQLFLRTNVQASLGLSPFCKLDVGCFHELAKILK